MHTLSASPGIATVLLSALSALKADISAPAFSLLPAKILALRQVLIAPVPVKIGYEAWQKLPTH